MSFTALSDTTKHAALKAGVQAKQVMDSQSPAQSETVIVKMPAPAESIANTDLQQAIESNIGMGNRSIDKADPETTRSVTSIIGGFNDRLPEMARHMEHPPVQIQIASEVRVFVTEDPEVNMKAMSVRSEDGGVVEAVVITKGAIELMKSDPEAFKAMLAHEHGHSITQLNPGIENDGLFKAKSREYNEEETRLYEGKKFGSSTQEDEAIASAKKQAAEYHQQWTPELEASVRKTLEDEKELQREPMKAKYDKEGKADKMGLWLDPDLDAALRFQAILSKGQYNMPERAAGEDFKSFQSKIDDYIERSFDPHPSSTARVAEEKATADEIRKAEGANAVHDTSSPTKPADTPKPPQPPAKPKGMAGL